MCRFGRMSLVTSVLDHGEAPEWMATHVSHCLSCQALTAQTRRLRRDLARLPAKGGTGPEEDGSTAGTAMSWKLVGAALIALLVVTRKARGDGMRMPAPSFLSADFAVYSGFRRTP